MMVVLMLSLLADYHLYVCLRPALEFLWVYALASVSFV